MRLSLFLILALLPAAAQAQVTPGQWEIVTTVDSMDMPGAPPGIAAMMKGRPIKVRHCLTADEAARGPQEMMKARKECTFSRYAMTGGKLDSVMTCQQGGSTMTATSSGSFTPTDFATTSRTVMTGSHAMTMTAKTIGRRVGDCK